MGQEYDIFLSHQSADKEFTLKLAEALRDEGLEVFVDTWDIGPGDDIVGRIDQGLDDAAFVALVLSPEYLDAEWPTAEKNAALFQDPTGRRGVVVPLMRRRCRLPPLLAYRKYIDFTEGNFENGFDELMTVLTGTDSDGPTQVDQAERSADTDLVVRHLDSAQPDNVDETLYPNIFPVESLPSHIWSAPTEFRGLNELIDFYGRGETVPAHFIWNKRLYTFADLSSTDHPYIGVIENYDVQKESTDEWLNDPERRYKLTWLLNDAIRVLTRERGMTYTKKGDKYYYDKGVLEDPEFSAYGWERTKKIIYDYTNRSGGYSAHRAVKLRFLLIGFHPFLRIQSAWVFKRPNGYLIEGNRRNALNAKFLGTQKNRSNHNAVRFWAWFLSEEKDKMQFDIGGVPLEVDVSGRPLEISQGILGDQSDLTPVVEPPELVFQDDEDEKERPAESANDGF